MVFSLFLFQLGVEESTYFDHYDFVNCLLKVVQVKNQENLGIKV